VLGHVLDKAGKKESKSSGNYTPPEVIMDAVRMQFGVAPSTAPYADGARVPEGTAYIAPEDLDGLDLGAGAEVVAYRKDRPDHRVRLKLGAKKKLPRRVVLLSEAARADLGLDLAPEDVMPVEVPSLPPEQRVMLEYDQVPAPGADAFRWFFYASNPPWNSTRHSLGNVRKLQKELPIKVRNVYSFFVTYANIDGFDPVGDEAKKRPVAERPLLDRWIVSELEKTKQRVTDHMDAFRSYEATQVLSEFVDGLSNWYVRRSRDRFWAEGREQDKLDAYWTLFQCLRDLTLLLAPFLPFSAEDMYQNLVVGPYGEGFPDSVHLRLYPSGDQRLIDEELSRDMADVRALVSLGLQVRAAEKLKIRQMLSEAKFVLARPERREALARYAEIMKDELNVRTITFLERADEFVRYSLKPNFKVLGRRLGPKMKAVQRALAEGDAEGWVRALESEGGIVIAIDDQEVRLGPEDVAVSVEPKTGFAAASAPVGVVVLDTTLDEALLEEGRFREVLARVQNRRKELNLDFTDRIRLGLAGSEKLVDACRSRHATLASETLAAEVKLGEVPDTAVEVKVGDEPLLVYVEKV
jgi:isoleucyl-tRNA synthetase